jgi:hypothetical protein
MGGGMRIITQCGAFAHSDSGRAIQTRNEIESAKEAAIAPCEKRGNHCRIVAAVCADCKEKCSGK